MKRKLEILSKSERYDYRNLKVADGEPIFLEGACVTINGDKEVIAIGSTPVLNNFKWLVFTEQDRSPGVGSNIVSLIEPVGHISLKTTIYDQAQTYAALDPLVMKNGRWEPAVAGDPVDGYVWEDLAVAGDELILKWVPTSAVVPIV